MSIMINKIILFALVMFMFGCAEIEPEPFEPSTGHINTEESPAPIDSMIPELVEQVPLLPEPSPVEPPERYTVVVNEVPVKELLFALARDAKVNVDIHPGIEGVVTINAVEQTLPQILKRISNQVDMRYEQDENNLIISQDTPFLRTYKVDYVNLSRNTSSTSSVSTQISSTSGGDAESSSGGGNTSTTDVSTESTHNFWLRLVTNISAILGEATTRGASSGGASSGRIPVTKTVIPNPESGILTVRATAKQHEQIQFLIDQVLVSAKRQVMIQTTIVEVSLNEKYRAGIDWNTISTGVFTLASTAAVPEFAAGAAISSFVIKTNEDDNNAIGTNPSSNADNISATIELLDEFGDTKVLSSPQMMVLNNQTALLKVVENIVYFEIDAESTATQGVTTTTVDTDAKTVPVGIVMTITPQIDSNGAITLVVRPTISRFVKFVNDPNPNLVVTGTGGTTLTNPVPQIAVREMESVLRLIDGQTGVLGGLMTDDTRDNDAGLPGAKEVGFFGNFFKRTSAEYAKTELVIFLKPTVIRNPSIDNDLEEYRKYISKDYQPLSSKVEQGDDAL
jgi:MSHA biogenesis protein MshL